MRRTIAAAPVAAAFVWAAAFVSGPAAAGFLGGEDLHGHCTTASID